MIQFWRLNNRCLFDRWVIPPGMYYSTVYGIIYVRYYLIPNGFGSLLTCCETQSEPILKFCLVHWQLLVRIVYYLWRKFPLEVFFIIYWQWTFQLKIKLHENYYSLNSKNWGFFQGRRYQKPHRTKILNHINMVYLNYNLEVSALHPVYTCVCMYASLIPVDEAVNEVGQGCSSWTNFDRIMRDRVSHFLSYASGQNAASHAVVFSMKIHSVLSWRQQDCSSSSSHGMQTDVLESLW